MAKPMRKRDKPRWLASHRVNAQDDWQYVDLAKDALGQDPWTPIDYDDVPNEIWSMGYRRDGWTFYTDRTRPCNERGFPT